MFKLRDIFLQFNRSLKRTIGVSLLLVLPITANAATIDGSTTLLTQPYANQIETWLGNDDPDDPVTFTKIYAKPDGNNSGNGSDFHTAADDQGPTIVLMNATDRGISSIVGGYNPKSWNSSNQPNYTDIADRTAFLFNLTTPIMLPQIGGYQTQNLSGLGPTFGNGYDLHVDETLNSGYSNLYSYGTNLGISLVSGYVYAGDPVQYYNLEVFTVRTADTDGDGVLDSPDNCTITANPNQTDNDNDGMGDVCDGDDDNDSVPDVDDNCPLVANIDQANTDGNALGDACYTDLDGDSLDNDLDNCPAAANPDQTDTDDDGEGDECDINDDGDNFADADDNCPTIVNNDQADLDDDQIGDACDADLDGDGVADNDDADMDGDGVDNAADSCAATPLGALNDANGCTIDQLCPCEGPSGTTTLWRNHGKYVSCVAHAANDFLDAGLIVDSEHGDIVSEAGMSDCGGKK